MKLENILTYKKGKAPQKIEHSDNYVIYLSPEYLRGNAAPTLVQDYISKVSVNDNDLLLLWDGSNAGEFFKGKEGVLSSTMVKFNFDLKKYNRNFLFYQLKNFEDYLKSQTNGSGIPHVDKEILLGLNICEFSGLEQTRIAQILSQADEAIANTEALIAKYQRIKTGLMQDLLTRGIDPQGQIRSETTHAFKDSPLGRIPVEWEVKKLVDCTDKSTIITYGIVQTGPNVEDGVRVLRTVDLFNDRINTTNLLRTTKGISDSYKRTILKENDIVCNVRASVGDFNIINEELVNCNTTRGVARISPSKELNPFYLLWYLRSERNTKQMELLIKGTTFIDINIADLRKLNVIIPKSRSEQNNIADKLNKITKTIESFVLNLAKLQSIKRGLMQDLLSGRVRVGTPQTHTTA